MAKLHNFIYIGAILATLVVNSPLSAKNLKKQRHTGQTSAEEKDSSIFDIKIKEFDYTRPENPADTKAGVAKAELFKMSTDSIDVSVENKNEVFDAEITYKDGKLGFQGDTFGFAQKLEEDSFLSNITKAQAVESKLFKDLDVISLEAKNLSFNFEDEDERFEFSGGPLLLKCIIPSDAKGLGTTFTSSCLGDSTLQAKTGNKFKFLFNYIDQSTDFKLDSTINKLIIDNDRVHLVTQMNSMVIDNEYKITVTPIKADCAKEANPRTFNQNKLLSDCFTDIKVDTEEVAIYELNSKNNTVFRIFPENLKVSNKKIKGFISKFLLDERKKGTSFNNMNIDCYKNPKTFFYDYYSIFQDCFVEGDLTIESISSEKYSYYKEIDDEVKKLSRRHKVKLSDDEISREVKYSKRPMVKDIQIGLLDNSFKMLSKVKILGLYADINVSGKIFMDEEEGEIAIDIQELKVPLGFGKSFVLSILKLYLEKIVKTDSLQIREKILYIKI